MTGEDNSPIQRHFRVPNIYLQGGTVLALFCGALTSATPGDAHSDLLRSSPISDTVLSASPGEIIFFFSEPVVVETSDVQLVDAADAPYDLNDFHHHGDATNPGLGVQPNLPSGVYTVRWNVISATDGHPASGSFSFEVVQSQSAPDVTVTVHEVNETSPPQGGPVLVGALLFLIAAPIALALFIALRRR
jgi:methionine-rich copper-binding protein CopC